MKSHYEAKEVEQKRLAGLGKIRIEGKKWMAIDTVGESRHGVTCASREEAEEVAAELNRLIDEPMTDTMGDG